MPRNQSLPSPTPASKLGRAATPDQLAAEIVETALFEMRKPGSGCKADACWKLARVVGWLSRGLRPPIFKELVEQSLEEGRQGMLL